MVARKGSHSVFSVKRHFVFVTHYRRKIIDAAMIERLQQMFDQVCKAMDCELIEFSGESDHVHLLVDFHPKHSISAVVGSLKAATSRMIKKEFPERFSLVYKKDTAFWAGSYYVASTGGAPIERIKKYIQSQEKPDT